VSLSLFDTHCHLADPALVPDLPDVIERARTAGVTEVLIIGLNVENSLEAQCLADQWGFHFAAGIHPSDCATANEVDFETIAKILKSPSCRAVGEIGLDFYHPTNPTMEKQIEVFRRLLSIASDARLPIVIHQRKSAWEVLRIIDEFNLPAGGVFHCFSGDWEYAQEVLRRGFYISIAGNITYKNTHLIETVVNTPLDRLLIETDAPYLTPVPFRGKRNEPAYIAYTAARIAELRNLPLEDLAMQLNQNAQRLFGSGAK